MRPLLVRGGTFAAAMARRLTTLAIVGIGANEHAAPRIIGDDLVEIGILGAAQRARRVEAIARERMVLEIERYHLGVRRNRIDALLAAGTEQLQRRTIVHLRIVEFRRRR